MVIIFGFSMKNYLWSSFLIIIKVIPSTEGRVL
jgi:hypothetical protein